MRSEDKINFFIKTLASNKNFDVELFKKAHSAKQKEYFEAKEKYVMYQGGRRAGKTLGNCSDCIISDKTLLPELEARIIFASATIGKTKDLYWTPLMRANKTQRLGWQFKSGENKIVTPSNIIVFRGLKDIPSAELDMGFAVKRVYVDEIQTIREKVIKHYFENVISWGLTGIKGARVNITGNPPPFRMEYLENLYKNEKIRKIHTTMFDNPGISPEEIREIMQSNADMLGKSLEDAENDPVFLRNIYGKWVYSNEFLVFNPKKIKTYEELPDELHNFRIVIGVDIGGGKAQDAIVVLGWHVYSNQIFLLDEKLLDTKEEDIESLATWIKHYDMKYESRGCPPEAISIDTGALGDRIANILRRRYGVTKLIAAIKKDKMSHLEEMKTEFYRGRFKLKADSILREEMRQIIYTPDYKDIDDEQGLHSDLLDACLYSFRFISSQWPLRKEKEKTYEEKRLEYRLNQLKTRKIRVKTIYQA